MFIFSCVVQPSADGAALTGGLMEDTTARWRSVVVVLGQSVMVHGTVFTPSGGPFRSAPVELLYHTVTQPVIPVLLEWSHDQSQPISHFSFPASRLAPDPGGGHEAGRDGRVPPHDRGTGRDTVQGIWNLGGVQTQAGGLEFLYTPDGADQPEMYSYKANVASNTGSLALASVLWGSVLWGSVQWGSVQWGGVLWGSVLSVQRSSTEADGLQSVAIELQSAPTRHSLPNGVERMSRRGEVLHTQREEPEELASPHNLVLQCPPNELQCQGTEVCVHMSKLCNGMSDCPDGGDEGAHCRAHRGYKPLWGASDGIHRLGRGATVQGMSRSMCGKWLQSRCY
ncbi:hypothetical protein NFI96_014240 [Prochilodus magdalenae]|nr:hypothetical protein NFI96_014240 [Prochilodus magdalenae]